MKKESKKIARIIDELSTHYLERSPSKLNVCVDNLEDLFKISFEVFDVAYSDEEIESMLEILNEPRLPAVETYYWTLTSESSDNSELSLIGTMIDKAEMYFKDCCLYVNLYRNKL